MPIRSTNGSRPGRGGGALGSIALEVEISEVASNRMVASWDNPGGAGLFHVFRKDAGNSTYIGETVDQTIEIPVVGAMSPRNVSAEVYSLDGSGSATAEIPAMTTNPNTPYRLFGDNMSFGSSYAISEQGTHQLDILNTDSFPIVAAAAVLPSTVANPSQVSAIGYSRAGEAWTIDTDIPTIPAGPGVISGDSQPTPALAIADLQTVTGGVGQGQLLRLHVVSEPGGDTSNITRALCPNYHPSADAAGGAEAYIAGSFPGDYTSYVEAPSTSVGMVVAEMGGGAEICNVLIVADSTGAQTMPNEVPYPPASYEGWMYQANLLAIAAASKLRFSNVSQGNANLSTIRHRAEMIMAYPGIFNRLQLMLVQVATPNQEFADAAAADAAYALYQATAAAITTATGVVVRPLMLTPAPSFAQSAGNLAAWTRLRELIEDADGADLSDTIDLGTHMIEDGAHVNAAGQTLQAAAAYTRTRDIAIRAGLTV